MTLGQMPGIARVMPDGRRLIMDKKKKNSRKSKYYSTKKN
jgi:hypothetical protein